MTNQLAIRMFVEEGWRELQWNQLVGCTPSDSKQSWLKSNSNTPSDSKQTNLLLIHPSTPNNLIYFTWTMQVYSNSFVILQREHKLFLLFNLTTVLNKFTEILNYIWIFKFSTQLLFYGRYWLKMKRVFRDHSNFFKQTFQWGAFDDCFIVLYIIQ